MGHSSPRLLGTVTVELMDTIVGMPSIQRDELGLCPGRRGKAELLEFPRDWHYSYV